MEKTIEKHLCTLLCVYTHTCVGAVQMIYDNDPTEQGIFEYYLIIFFG